MSKYKILIGSFIFLSTVISFFPPFSWGDEKLRTISERQTIHYYLEDKIPVKGYDFLFNDLKKEFVFSSSKVTLERHLIVSELLIEIFIALLISIFLQFFYRRLSYRVIFFSLYTMSIIIGLILSLFVIDKTSPWFQPDYSNVLLIEDKIRNDFVNPLSNIIRRDYVRLIRDNSIAELSRIVDNLKSGFRKDWDDPTNLFWDAMYSSSDLNSDEYPRITEFLEKNVELNKNKSHGRFDFTDWSDKYYAKHDKEFVLDNFIIYRNYTPPNGYSVNYSKLLNRIDVVKYHALINTLQNYPAYTSVVTEYRKSFENYWTNIIPKIKLFTTIGIVLIITLIFYLRKEWLINKIKMYNKRLNIDRVFEAI